MALSSEQDRIDQLIRELAVKERSKKNGVSSSLRENYSKVVLDKRMFISVIDSSAEAMVGNGAIER